MMGIVRLVAVVLFAGLATNVHATDVAAKRPMTIEDMFKFKRVADPQISPDGKQVAYQITSVDLEANKTSTALWLAAMDGKTPPRQITNSGKRDAHPRWSPDGTKLLFESTRGGSQQLYVLDLTAGGEAKPITHISTDASSGIWSPDGSHVAFVSAVYPEFSELPFAESDAKNKEKLDAADKSPVKAKVFTKLFYRHWDEYVGDKRQHLFVCKADGSNPHDATPGDRDASPTSSTFSSSEDFTFSPDSQFLVFTAVPEKSESWSTNYDLCRVSIGNKSTKWETLTNDNKAADSGPRFSPDGKKLAWRTQKQAGYEADRWNVIAVDCRPDGTLAGPPIAIVREQDLSVNEFIWSPDGASIAFTADQQGGTPIFTARLSGSSTEKLQTGGTFTSLSAVSVGSNDAIMTFARAQMNTPPEVFVLSGGIFRGLQLVSPRDRSLANTVMLGELDLPRPESVWVPADGGINMQMWILKPPGFDPKKKWPVVYLVHGGPQGAWEDGWSNRWNPELWAAQGYVIALPNPRGSTGFGQKFVDEITGDWGGKCYRDLVAGLDYVEKLPFVDKDRIGSAGASFGGYMMDWFAVSEIAPRFKTLITHCSVWNFESMWGTTDELWFDEWEHGGLPWEKPGKYAEFSPHKKAGNLGKYKVPMLVIHNDLDFRCPIGQGHELFSALQRQGVPSRFVNFPDEGHWVLKPQNSLYWHKEVFAWLKKYVPPGGK